MATQYNGHTDHWSKMRMNIIKNTINNEKRGRVLNWQKHQKVAAQQELEAGIRGTRSLPQYNVSEVHNFQDVFQAELNGFLPGSSYARRRMPSSQTVEPVNQEPIFSQYRRPMLTGSNYTLMTLPTDPRSDQTRSRVPVLQCRGKI